jgi:hypothetical protein
MAIVVIFKIREPLQEGRDYDLKKGYAMRFDRGHVPGAEDHIHFFRWENELYAINRNGSGHDGNHGTPMHNYAVKKAKALFPDFSWPDDNIIEGVDTASWLPSFREFLRRNSEAPTSEQLSEAITTSDAVLNATR